MLEILKDEEYYDITIEVGSDPDVKIFCAHIIVLEIYFIYYKKGARPFYIDQSTTRAIDLLVEVIKPTTVLSPYQCELFDLTLCCFLA